LPETHFLKLALLELTHKLLITLLKHLSSNWVHWDLLFDLLGLLASLIAKAIETLAHLLETCFCLLNPLLANLD